MNETVEELKQRAAALRRQPHQTAEHINALNETAWKLRHADTSLAAELSSQSLRLTARADYELGRAYALRTIGFCQLRSDQYPDAAATVAKSRAVFASSPLSDVAGLASTINLLAITQKYLGQREAALENCLTAADLCTQIGEKQQSALIYNNIAGIYSWTGDYDAALDYYYQAFEIYAESSATVSQGWLYGNLSGILWRLGEPQISIEYSQQAINLLRAHYDRRNEAMAQINLGAAWQSIGDYQNASDNYFSGLHLARETRSFEVQAEAQKCIGSLLIEKGNAELALNHLWQALQLSQSISSLYSEGETLIYLGSAYEQLGNKKRSALLYEEALEISERLGLKEVRARAHLALSKLFEKQKKVAAALAHYQNFHKFWQEVFGATTARRIERLLLEKEFKQNQFETPVLQRAHNRRLRAERASATRQTSSALAPHKLQQILEFIDHHLDQNLTLAALADVAGLNYDHFIRCFKRATNQTPHQFLLEQRVERAKLLLKTTTLALAEIALRCGFNSQPHLTTQFRSATGITPHQFRQNARS